MNSVTWAVSACVAQVAFDSSREQRTVLGDVADVLSQFVLRHLPDVDAVD
jgi:hypothetical protein